MGGCLQVPARWAPQLVTCPRIAPTALGRYNCGPKHLSELSMKHPTLSYASTNVVCNASQVAAGCGTEEDPQENQLWFDWVRDRRSDSGP